VDKIRASTVANRSMADHLRGWDSRKQLQT
jgi:hypothetical protein